MIVLRLPFVLRRTDLVEGRRRYHFERRSAELSWRQVGLLTQSLQRCCPGVLASVHMYMVYVCAYMCVCMCLYENAYMYIVACVYV